MLSTITPVTAAELNRALEGVDPPTGHKLTLGELGRRLAKHRRGRYPGQAFSRQAVSLYRRHPSQQSPDFIAAFRSWVIAERLRQDQLSIRFANGMTVDEMLDEAGFIVQVGEDPVRQVLVVGRLPPDTLIGVNGVVELIYNRAGLVHCACGRWAVRRSWNQKRCEPGCGR